MADSLLKASFALTALAGTVVYAASARAADPTGTPPPDATALVAAPATSAKAPEVDEKNKLDVTTVAVSAGGQLTTGNSRLLAGTASGEYETRFSNNGIGAKVLGNYGESATPGAPLRTSAENVQGSLRYDRFLVDRLSLFLINTGRHDRFQGLDFRYNLDPGVKYLFVMEDVTKLWGELGYDFQYDIRRDDARRTENDDGTVTIASKTNTDHSLRAFVGFTHAFNDAVNLNTGLEYLQSFEDAKRSRLNFDALFAAKLGAGLALGAGFSARFDNAPLAGKKKLDTVSTLSLIYSFSDAPAAQPPAPPPAPCAPVPACTTSEPPVPTAPPTSQPTGAPAEPPPPSDATPALPPAAAPTSPPSDIAPAAP